MMQGDQYRIPVEINDTDGTPLTQDKIKDLEIMVGNFRKTLSGGGIGFEEAENVFYVFVTQKETFTFRGDITMKARILFLSGDVIGINLGTINFETSASKVVLK